MAFKGHSAISEIEGGEQVTQQVEIVREMIGLLPAKLDKMCAML